MSEYSLEKLKAYCTEIGLSNNEVKCYLSCLRLGPATVSEIAKEMRVFRSSAYLFIDQLSKRGLVSQEKRKRGTVIVPESPTQILQLLRSRQRKLKRDEIELAETIPKYINLFNRGRFKPVTRLYEGNDGLKAIHNDILSVGETMYCYPRVDLSVKVLPMEFQAEWVKERIAHGIRTKAIVSDVPEARDLANQTISKENPDALREIRLLPVKIKLSAEKIIYGNRVAMLSYEKKITGSIIEHEEFAEMERELFNLLWRLLEPKHNKVA